MEKEKDVVLTNENRDNSVDAEPAMPQLETTRKPGGLYAKINMSVKTANILVLCTVAILVIVTAFIVMNNGFTISFDTDGGSHIDSVRVMHSELVPKVDDPVKEGYTFNGWYTDKDCTNEWHITTDKVEGSMTLYAGWTQK